MTESLGWNWSMEMLLWLLPIVFFLHDGEEIATMERWVRSNKDNPSLSSISSVRIRWDKNLTFSFTFAVLVLGLVLSSITWHAAVRYEAAGSTPFLYAGFVAVFLLDGIKHVGATMLTRKYTPGVITAALLEIPFGAYALYNLFHLKMIDLPALALGLAIAVPVTLFLVWSGLTLGMRLAPVRNMPFE
ncbi:HXXEE domain-containing protein [Paenibacillus ihbetae]|uniref:HXXEE domain-containing protein n=1 Tax=Paenibacillus ihbetae TaxID=1870820 RepID=UPI001CB9B876|nr:HXXEE domain-containing protein [Paenibacillus ihbetae]